jgi:hypothetical protein
MPSSATIATAINDHFTTPMTDEPINVPLVDDTPAKLLTYEVMLAS